MRKELLKSWQSYCMHEIWHHWSQQWQHACVHMHDANVIAIGVFNSLMVIIMLTTLFTLSGKNCNKRPENDLHLCTAHAGTKSYAFF